MALRRPRQLELPVPAGWGGRRTGAGRKPGPRPWVPRTTRPPHDPRHPVHVTLRAVPGLRSFRGPRVFAEVRDALATASKPAFRLCEFSVQSNHLHLLVEADSREALIRGVQGLAIRTARAINRALGRCGKVWGDRRCKRRGALLRRGEPPRCAMPWSTCCRTSRSTPPGRGGIDRCSSGAWFAGWRAERPSPPPGVRDPVVPAKTWLLGAGWTRHGLLDVEERPRA